MWLIATARNALLVLLASLGAFYAHNNGQTPFILTGTVKPGLPDIQMPPFQTTLSNNGTIVELGFLDMVSKIYSFKFVELYLTLQRKIFNFKFKVNG